MFEINIFPIYGAMIGFNYWNEDMDEYEKKHADTQHMVQFMFILFGFSIIWYEQN